MSLTRLTNLISSTEGRFLYVDPNEFNASDLISNRGNSPTRPFKTIQRALLEVARFSYVAGPDKGNDKYDQFTILLSPGDHWIDNRPGYILNWDKDANYWNTDQTINSIPVIPQLDDQSNFNIFDDNNDLFKFNSIEGGLIIPRGTSLVGSDLRKTRIRPRYVPDPMYAEYMDSDNPIYTTSDYKVPGAYVEEAPVETLPRAAFFRVTGACYFWQFSIFDAVPTNTGGIYRYATNDPADVIKYTKYTQNYEWNLNKQSLTSNETTGLGSHHKLTGFEYANGMSVSDIVCTSVINSSDTTIFLNKINSGSQARLYMGDLLLINNSISGDREVVKVKKVYPELNKVDVYRNQLGTTAPAVHPISTGITKLNDLGLYYAKVARGFSKVTIEDPIIDASGEIEARQQENRIVGPLNVDNRISSINITNIVNTKFKITVTTRGSHGLFKNQIISLKDLDVTETSQGSGFSGGINGTVFVTSVVNANTIECEKVLSASTIAQTYTFNSNAAATLIADIDTVDSASPYIFNCSIRSVFGICGMLTDGSKATGFKSMVVAQYTGVSLQKDDRAFIRYMYQIQNRTDNQGNPLKDPAFLKEGESGYVLPSDQVSTTVATLHSEGSAFYQDNWRTFHVHITNEGLIQAVSVFAVGFCDHFIIEDGGDISITNSNSNFGNTALRAIGFREKSFPQDKFGKITHIIPPKSIDTEAIDEITWYPFDVAKTKVANTNNVKTKLHLFNAKVPGSTPLYLFDQKYVLGGKQNEQVELEVSLGAITAFKYVNLATNTDGQGTYEHVQTKVFTINPNTDVCTLSNNATHQWRTGTPVRIESEMGYLPDGIEPNTTYYIITENGGRWATGGAGWSGPTGNITNRDSQFKLAKTLEEAKAGTAIDIRTDNPPKTVLSNGSITATGELRVIQKIADIRPTPASFEFVTNGATNEFIAVNDATAAGGNYTEIPHGFDKGQPIFFAKTSSTDTLPTLSSGALDVKSFYYAYPTSPTRFKIVLTQNDADNDRNLISLGAISAAGRVKVYANAGQWSVTPWITRHPLQYDPTNPLTSNPVDTETGTFGNWIVICKNAGNEVIDAILNEADFQGDQAPKATQPSKLKRQRDIRSNYDRTYRFRYVIPKEFRAARPPFLGYVIKLRTNSDGYVLDAWDGGTYENYDQYERTYYIYDVTEVQDFIPGVQDGVYYLTLLLADVQIDHDRMIRGDGGSIAQNWFKKFKFSQNTAELYPALDADNPESNPVAALSVADHKVHGYVFSNSRLYSVTREAAEKFLADNRYTPTEISNICTDREGSARRGREDQSRIFPIGYLRTGSTNRTEDVGIQIELRRPSLVRSGNHTFEYVGYGPGNYSTAFPAKQQKELTDREVVVSQAKKEDAGVVFYSGLNSQGDLYVGNQKINAVTGQIEIIDESILEISSVPTDNIPVGDEEGANNNLESFDLVVKGTLTVENSDSDAANRQKGSVRGPTKFLGGVQFNTPKNAGTKTQKVTFYGAGNAFSVENTGDYRGIHDLLSTNNISLRAVGLTTVGNVTTFDTVQTDNAFRKDFCLWKEVTRPTSYVPGGGASVSNMVNSNGEQVQVTWALGNTFGDFAYKPAAAYSDAALSNNTTWVFMPDSEGTTDGWWYQTGLTKTGALYPYEDRDSPTTGRLGINAYYRNSSRPANFYVKTSTTRPNDWILGVDGPTNNPILWIDQNNGGSGTQPTITVFKDDPAVIGNDVHDPRTGNTSTNKYNFEVASGFVSKFGDVVVFGNDIRCRSDIHITDDIIFYGQDSGITIPNTHLSIGSRRTNSGDHFLRVESGTSYAFTGLTASGFGSGGAPSIFSDELQQDIMNQALPSGSIIMWYGSSSNIPQGYVLCNGSTYTGRDGQSLTSPNMTDRFVRGATTTGVTGGVDEITRTVTIGGHELSRPEIPAHTHGLNENYWRHKHYLSTVTEGVESGGAQVLDGIGAGSPGGAETSAPYYDNNGTNPGSNGVFTDILGQSTMRSGPGTGGDSNGTGYHSMPGGLSDPRRQWSDIAGNTLGRAQGSYRALEHYHSIQISGTGQSTSGNTDTTSFSQQSATMSWDNKPVYIGMVFMMKL